MRSEYGGNKYLFFKMRKATLLSSFPLRNESDMKVDILILGWPVFVSLAKKLLMLNSRLGLRAANFIDNNSTCH